MSFVRTHRRLASGLLVAGLVSGVLAGSGLTAATTATAEPAAAGLETSSEAHPVAPGVEAEEVETYGPRGWQVANALTVDLDQGARLDYLSAGSLTDLAPITEQAEAAGAVAAVNGDFFDIDNSGSPIGPVIAGGELLKSPSSDLTRALAFDESGAGRVTDIEFTGNVRVPDGNRPLDRLNSSDLPENGIGAYDANWGEHPRTRAVQGAENVTEVLLDGNRVEEVNAQPGKGTLPEGSVALVGREQGGKLLAALEPGDRVRVNWRGEAADGEPVHTSIGARELLVENGEPQPVDDELYAARTAFGLSADGTELVVLSTDGDNQSHSRGATLAEMGELMAARGVDVAVEIDGGGSSTMVSRSPGTEGVRVDNTPSDGSPRKVPNGLGIFAPEGSEATTGLWTGTALRPEQAATDAPDGKGDPDRVFAGLGRTVRATPHDETYGPVADDREIGWLTTNGTVTDGATAVVTPSRPGKAIAVPYLSGEREQAKDKWGVPLDVLASPTRIATTERSVNVPSVQGKATFGVYGYDADGNSAPIEPADVELDYDKALFDIEPDGVRGFTVLPKQDTVAGLVTVRVGDLETELGVTVGVQRHSLDEFDDPSGWHADATRATAEVEPVEQGEDGPGLRLSYDFTQATKTRLAVAELDEPLGVEGQSRSFGLSIHGNGQGEWSAFTFEDAQGNALPAVYGPYIGWEGWRTVELAVPEGYPQELSFKRLTIIETQAARQYTGEVLIDNLYVEAAPSIDVPPPPRVTDRVVAQDAGIGGQDWRFAVLNDAQFVASDPDSPIVRSARRTLREIKAADPDFFVIAGDFVDEASEADFQLAKRILDEEIGAAVPYYYVPGNHEVMGADIGNFEKYFGDTHRTFDHEGTRFVTLNTAPGTLRDAGFEQITMLREALDDAAEDRSINSVVVIEHHPPRDPSPGANSQLADRNEAALLERWLAEFRARTGKGAAFVGGHVGLFHASRVDGVPYVISGNSGKAPSTGVDQGGFTGWSMFGVDRDGRRDWFSAELRPHVDELTVDAPDRLTVGETARLAATVTQAGEGLDERARALPGSIRTTGSASEESNPTTNTVEVPVDHPVSSRWRPSRNVYVGDPDDAGSRHVAAYDPETRELTALRPGPVRITVTVNDAERTVPIRVIR